MEKKAEDSKLHMGIFWVSFLVGFFFHVLNVPLKIWLLFIIVWLQLIMQQGK